MHQDYVWKMPTIDRIVEESTSSWLDGRQRAGVEFWVPQAGACKLGGMLRAAVTPSHYTPTQVGSRWGGDGAPGRGKKEISMLQSGSTPVSSGRSRKHVWSLPLLFAGQEISIKGGLYRRRQRRGLSGSKISRGVPGQTVLPNVVSRYGRSGLRRAGNPIIDRDTSTCLSSVLCTRMGRWTMCGRMNSVCA